MNDAFKSLGRSFYDMEEDEKSWTLSKLEDGVLTLKLAKLEQKTARQITVN